MADDTNGGKVLIQVEHYLDADPTQPEAYQRFLARMQALQAEYGNWRTVVFDSATFMELAARKWHQYTLNSGAREPRQWFAGSTDLLEETLMIRGGSLPMHVLCICHIDEDKDEVNGLFVRNPAAPGRLRKRLASAYGELYRQYVATVEDGSRVHWLQTRGSAGYNASTQLRANDPCEPTWKGITANQAPNGPVHGVVYGDSGAGKSTFAATWPKPMLVLSFDPYGKERPYTQLGAVTRGVDGRGTPVEYVRAAKVEPVP